MAALVGSRECGPRVTLSRLVRHSGRPVPAGAARVSHLPDLGRQGIKVGVTAGLFLAVDELSVDHDLEDAAGAGDEDDFGDAFRSERAQLGRQTGGARLVISHLAVFDGDVLDHGKGKGGRLGTRCKREAGVFGGR